MYVLKEPNKKSPIQFVHDHIKAGSVCLQL